MSVLWTKEQRQVIELRNRNILVSAAAGSGKTAVLVERIKERVLDEKNPIEIDEMLVVTFTNAAAAQMRERVGKAIEDEMEKNPANLRLSQQLALVHNAQITTIDSFCLYVIRNHFHCIDLEPNFRIGDEGELKLLKGEVIDHVIESAYVKGEESFLDFVDSYAAGRTDAALKELILQLYTYSQSYPWPKEWLLDCTRAYQIRTKKEFEQSPFMEVCINYLSAIFAGIQERIDNCIKVCEQADGPYMYTAAFESDKAMVTKMQSCDTYEMLAVHMKNLNYARLTSARGFLGNIEKADFVKAQRDDTKKTLKKLNEKFFFATEEQFVGQMETVAGMVDQLVALTIHFSDCFAAKKRDRNLVDFGDLEHFALEILVDAETKEPSATAEEFQCAYAEIMIDEYQDSNYVQETILRAISRECKGENNIFMVGDVKQSIYRFRLARPELFMEKYDNYALTDSKNQRIDLHKNFRSRDEILQITNDIFFLIMQRDLGNVVYDEEAALYPGADYPIAEKLFEPEILIADGEDELLSDTDNLDKQSLEAKMVADKIKQMLAMQLVTDKDSGELRNIKYSDIVILFRSLSGWADTFAKVLGEQGIPAHTASKTGYFSTMEIQTILSYLRILDNPKQDIPLAAVLKSPIGGLADEDMAVIRAAYPNGTFYEAVFSAIEENNIAESVISRVRLFSKTYKAVRKRVADMPIHELIMLLLAQTGYGNYVAAMPGGTQREANVDMLIEKAIAYENTSYRGLYHFIRYIDELQKYDVDFGEADLVSEHENAVRIMSIHKSKGLEFPVVFVSGLGKQFNRQDIRSKMILHPQLGIGLDEINSKKRIRIPTLVKRMIGQQTDLENLGEELRILYVALTRAQEKLVLTGVVKKAQEKVDSLKIAYDKADKISFLDRAKANTYLDWVLPALIAYGDRYRIQIITSADMVEEEVKKRIMAESNLNQRIEQAKYAREDIYQEVCEKLSYEYSFADTIDMVTKYSVSELKHRAMRQKLQQEELDITPKFLKEDMDRYVPPFISGMKENTEVNQGALRGTAVHRVFECLDFKRLPYRREETESEMQEAKLLEEELIRQIEHMLQTGKITEDMKKLIYPITMVQFLQSNIARRMCMAEQKDNLFREKPFVMGKPDYEIDDKSKIDEMVLIQGIIDVFWIEENQIVLLDYKTDKVESGSQLANMYEEQLTLYAEALQKNWGLPVKEKYLYSFRLHETILVE